MAQLLGLVISHSRFERPQYWDTLRAFAENLNLPTILWRVTIPKVLSVWPATIIMKMIYTKTVSMRADPIVCLPPCCSVQLGFCLTQQTRMWWCDWLVYSLNIFWGLSSRRKRININIFFHGFLFSKLSYIEAVGISWPSFWQWLCLDI